MRAFVVFALALLCSPASAAPLPPGKPAGVQEALSRSETGYLMLGVAVVSAALFASIFNFGGSSTSTSAGK